MNQDKILCYSTSCFVFLILKSRKVLKRKGKFLKFKNPIQTPHFLCFSHLHSLPHSPHFSKSLNQELHPHPLFKILFSLHDSAAGNLKVLPRTQFPSAFL